MKSRKLLSIPVIMLSILVLWGCPKKAEVSSTPETQKEEAPAVSADDAAKAEAVKAEESRKAAEAKAAEDARAAEEAKVKEQAAAASTGLQPIFFDFDKSFVREDARAAMKANADWLKANPKVKVRIEGNCDERGTKEYNQALGQRRATSAKKYLRSRDLRQAHFAYQLRQGKADLRREHRGMLAEEPAGRFYRSNGLDAGPAWTGSGPRISSPFPGSSVSPLPYAGEYCIIGRIHDD